jgi:hypothetical protein
MLYETLIDFVCSAILRCGAPGVHKLFQGNIPGKLWWNGSKRNEIAFVCIGKTKGLSHLLTNKNSQS